MLAKFKLIASPHTLKFGSLDQSMQVQWLSRVGSSLPIKPQRSILFQALNMEMATQSGCARRPVCPSCSKPTRICLCTRLNTPKLNNSVAITILQHSLEKKHPLNSTRIASIALQNLSIISVSDVHFQAQFFIRRLFNPGKIEEDAAVFTVEKYGTINSGFLPRCGFDLGKGFVVKKLQRKPGESEEEDEEFEVAVPPGSVLLFPSEESEGVEALSFEVKNLIVLDGTWAKAKRMYRENPWLKLLPHVKLDGDGMRRSLYGEVRHQPKEGCLSTIESIVYGLKAVGEEDLKGLDDVLDVFASMVGDQRRCKDERLSQTCYITK